MAAHRAWTSVPRSYEYALPKKDAARRAALGRSSAKLAEEKLTIVDAWSLDTHKTKTLRGSRSTSSTPEGKNGAACGLRRQQESRTRQPQYARREAFGQQRPAAL